MTILPEDLGRFGYATEGSFKGSPGTVKNPKGLAAHDPKAARARVPRPTVRNSAKDSYADKPGNQAYELATEFYLSDQSPTDIGDPIKTCLGEEVAAVSPTFSAASTNVSVTLTTQAPDNIGKVSDGVSTYYRPGIVTGSGPFTFTYTIKPPGGFTPTSFKNASQTSTPTGRAFRDKPDGTVDTYQLLSDQAGYTGELPIKGQGCVPNPFRVIWALGQLLKFGFTWKGAVWSILSAGTSGLADVADSSATYLSDAISLGLQDLATPVVLTELGPKALDMTLGYSMLAGTNGQGVSGGTVPASNVTSYIRHNSGEESIKLTLNDNDWQTWDTAKKNETAFQYWSEHQPGDAGATANASRCCIWVPKVKVVDVGRTKVDGVFCTALELSIERDFTNSLRRHYLSFFGTA